MRVFITGGLVHIGSAVIHGLQGARHQVQAVACSDPSTQKLGAAGAAGRTATGALATRPGTGHA